MSDAFFDSRFEEAKVLNGPELGLSGSIEDLLHPNHQVAVQNDLANELHNWHQHKHDETLLIVKGQLTLSIKETGQELIAYPGDRIQLPKGVVHKSLSGADGCTYIICPHRKFA